MMENKTINDLSPEVLEQIFSFFDLKELMKAQLVSSKWYECIQIGRLWKKIILRNFNGNPEWRRMCDHLELSSKISKNMINNLNAKLLCLEVFHKIEKMNEIWRTGSFHFIEKYLFIKNESALTHKSGCAFYAQQPPKILITKHKIVVGLRDGNIDIYNKRTLKLERTLMAHKDTVISLQIDPLLECLVSGSLDGCIVFWNLNSGEIYGSFLDIKLSGHLEELVYKKSLLLSLHASKNYCCITLRGIAGLFEIKSEKRLEFPNKQITSPGIHPSFIMFYIDNYDCSNGEIQLRSLESYEIIRTIPASHDPHNLVYTHGLIAMSTRDGFIRYWDVDTGKQENYCVTNLGKKVTFDPIWGRRGDLYILWCTSKYLLVGPTCYFIFKPQDLKDLLQENILPYEVPRVSVQHPAFDMVSHLTFDDCQIFGCRLEKQGLRIQLWDVDDV